MCWLSQFVGLARKERPRKVFFLWQAFTVTCCNHDNTVRACVRAHSDSEQKRAQSCVCSYVVRMFCFYLCLWIFLKRKKNWRYGR